MAKVPLVYHERYDLNFGSHVFPSRKYRLIRDLLLRDGSASTEDFRAPDVASYSDLALVHDDEWLQKLQNGSITYHEVLKLEVPYSRPMVQGFWLAAGGTTLAAHLALKHGVAYNVGGGFHHAFAGHGEGFCAIHDVAVAARVIQRAQLARKILIVDGDVHQGNGTAAIFADDQSVFTLSIHQQNNYPYVKPPSNLDINLDDGTGDVEYLERLRAGYVSALQLFRPEMVFFVAGADPYLEDQLGGLNLTKEGLMARDRLVVERALLMGIPVVIALAGGYSVKIEDTVEIHANTWRIATQVLTNCGWSGPNPNQ